ncbi:NAD-dependent epimerase/dehydratase family protein [Micromonospora rosaria]|uniref:NAD-dependent epimerase/dehydratase family protein n=1 Tax=Micromonospora rosaria TaxID=47874 RepID=UPI000ACA27EF|nr:NAD-dependent epimerase/dehydratase family protein [Micromonospora rosaria]
MPAHPTILLFGASGFLGGAVHRALAARAHVVAPARRECDLVAATPAELAALLTRVRPQALVVCAGPIVGSADDFTRAYPVVTGKLLGALAAAAPRARLVRLGSAAEYGVVAAGHRVAETDPARPVSDYGRSQFAATGLVESAGPDVDAVVLRVFNPVGPGLSEGNLLGRAATLVGAAVARGDPAVELPLDAAHRDFVDVRDVARAVVAAVHADRLPHRVYNVGSGTAVAVADAVRHLADLAGYAGGFTDGRRVTGTDRSSAVPWMCADVSRAGRDLDWWPEHTLTDSLAALWAARDDQGQRVTAPS